MEAKSRSKGIVYSTWLTSFCISNDVQESVSHTWLRSSRSKCTCSDWCSRACGILLGAEYRQGAFLVSSCVDGEITSKQSEWWINNEHHGGGGQNYLKKNPMNPRYRFYNIGLNGCTAWIQILWRKNLPDQILLVQKRVDKLQPEGQNLLAASFHQ